MTGTPSDVAMGASSVGSVNAFAVVDQPKAHIDGEERDEPSFRRHDEY
jgi:hypothetical protein